MLDPFVCCNGLSEGRRKTQNSQTPPHPNNHRVMMRYADAQ